jgi:alpha-mannosidase
MHILHFISHTHWDREWYEPFQIFRIRLAQTVDKALDILARDSDYKYFMLDGQTIVLEDYLEIQPEREAELRAHIRSGRVLVGPWYILPDEFLVSGEAIIRNLLRGIRIANSFGKCMLIGYVPDPFGHISQMPQILTGFGIHNAMFRRGLADEPTELWWEATDASRVLATYLRDGYDNAAWLAPEPEKFANGVRRLIESLAPYAVTEHMLMMHGTDHMQPWENLPQMIRAAEERIPEVRIIHSNLPEYAHAVEQALSSDGKEKLTIVKGELRNPKRHHLLPGVTSTRMWIKQRNARAQSLLEQWAEPLAAVAMNLPLTQGAVRHDLRPELHLAWKYLLQNHPHDSICGCSVDQVHAEMAPRFDWVEQIGGDAVKRSLASIVHAIDTFPPPFLQPPAGAHITVPIVVFIPSPGLRSDAVTVQVDLPSGSEQYQINDQSGGAISVLELGRHVEEYARVTATADDLRWTFGGMQSGRVNGYNLQEFAFRMESDQVHLDLTVSNQGEADPARLQAGLDELARYVAHPSVRTFDVRIRSLTKVDLTFFARDLPGYGHATFWLTPVPEAQVSQSGEIPSRNFLESEFFRVDPDLFDGTLTITDKTTGTVFVGANRFVDGGDRGDLYNHCPPAQDLIVDAPSPPPVIELLEANAVRQVMRIRSVLQVPASLTPDRHARSDDQVNLAISTVLTLNSGSRRLDFHTLVENVARDHRLCVEFPTPIRADKSFAGQAFDIVARDVDLPHASSEWVERPVPTKPLQQFVTINDGRRGLVLATRGLPEYEVKRSSRVGNKSENGEGDESAVARNGLTIALTLLRCIGWLSRPDLDCRRGDAGPERETSGAQELGTHSFEYSLIPYAVSVPPSEGITPKTLDWRGAHLEALAFSAPLRAVPTNTHAGLVPSSASWVQVSHPDFTLTAIKPPEEGEGMIVRGFNAGEETIRVQLKPFRRFAHVERINLNEDRLNSLDWNEAQQVELEVKPREIVTLQFEE